jgi:hypothetical protein
MKLDYSKKYTDKKGSAIIRGITSAGWHCFVRRQLPNGKPITWAEYNAGLGGIRSLGAVFQPEY